MMIGHSLFDCQNRRAFLRTTANGLGGAALATLLNAASASAGEGDRGVLGQPHFPPSAKRVIYLFMSGAPSQIELFDHKPALQDLFDKDLPDSVRMGQRFTTMTSGQKRFPLAPSIFKFARHGECGAEISELLPHTASIADEMTIIRSVHTEAINHDPAITYIQTGSQIPGRPSMGAWLSYGLGR